MITSQTIRDACGLEFDIDGFVGLANADQRLEGGPYITFCESERYLDAIRANPAIGLVFIRQDLLSKVEDMPVLVVEDPKWVFFSIVNHLAKTRARQKTAIGEHCYIHPSVQIAEFGVLIGDNVVIEPNVTILPDVVIGSGSVVRSGAAMGINGFEHKRTTRGILSVEHDGSLILGERVEVGPNNTVIKGFSYRDTVIGPDTKLDGLVHYAHGVQSGPRCMIAASAMIAGHVTLGADVWIGPGASISNRIDIGDGAYVTLGSVVTKSVPAGMRVTGNFAVKHEDWVRFVKSLGKDPARG